jgi:hypothetical protein
MFVPFHKELLRCNVDDKEHHKDNIVIILIFWCTWGHRSDVVFNTAMASLMAIREMIKVEYDMWRLAKLFVAPLSPSRNRESYCGS